MTRDFDAVEPQHANPRPCAWLKQEGRGHHANQQRTISKDTSTVVAAGTHLELHMEKRASVIGHGNQCKAVREKEDRPSI